jgi:hypothetical protein
MESKKYLQEAKENGYSFNTGNYFGKGFELFKSNPGELIGFTLLYFLISLTLSLIPVFGGVINMLITPALSIGFMVFCREIDLDRNTDFARFFDGFKKLLPLLGAYLLQLAIYLVIASPLLLIIDKELLMDFNGQDPEALIELWLEITEVGFVWIIILILYIYLAVSLRWAIALAYFYDFSPFEALKESFFLVNKNWFSHLIFLILGVLVIFLGVIGLLIGILITYPVYMAADYACFADITGLNKEDESTPEKEQNIFID